MKEQQGQENRVSHPESRSSAVPGVNKRGNTGLPFGALDDILLTDG